MIDAPVVLLGGLAKHARGRTLCASFGATPGEAAPVRGVAILFGRELQTDEQAGAWVEWTSQPGRLLLAVPPFAPGESRAPTGWEARRAEPLAGGETKLGRLLAGERQHEIRGQLLPLERIAGQIATAGWRRHPTAGLVAITSLPLWSLTALDHRDVCADWLASLWSQAGTAPETLNEPVPREGLRELRPVEWTLLLHLCAGPFADDERALAALEQSPIHRLGPSEARGALAELRSLGLASGGALTQHGAEIVMASPYAPFARVIRRQHGQA